MFVETSQNIAFTDIGGLVSGLAIPDNVRSYRRIEEISKPQFRDTYEF